MICKFNTCGTCFNCYSKNFNKDCFPCEDADPMTNADRIRAMTDEELAELIDRETDSCAPTGDCEKMSRDCKACWLEWLQQTAEGDDHDERKENENA